MRRLKDWPSRFAALVDEVRARPFAWGAHDCCLWAASAVMAITGDDPGAAWRGTYSTALGAVARLEALGGLEAAGARTGVPIELNFARIGDIGLVTWQDGVKSLAVCGGHSWMCAGDVGLVYLPLDSASRAWGVGNE